VSIEDDVAFLEKVPTFAVLGRPALRILAIGAETRNIGSGEVLFRAGDPADAGFVIQEGSFSLTADSAPGDQQTKVATRGALLSEYALFTSTKRTTTAIALAPAVVLRIPRSLFLKMLEGFPEAAVQLRAYFAARLDRTSRELANMRGAFVRKSDRGPQDSEPSS
jgi:CRP-like cAMP-binding protein